MVAYVWRSNERHENQKPSPSSVFVAGREIVSVHQETFSAFTEFNAGLSAGTVLGPRAPKSR